MKIEEKMAIDVVEALQALYGETIAPTNIQLQKTKREFEGHLTLVVFPFLRISRKKPEETAQEIGAYLKEHSSVVADFNVVKGFLNLCIDSAAWIDTLNDIHTAENYGLQPVTADAPLVMIEFSSPNTNKPLHLGHVRNNLLGWSLAKILEANGNRVVKTNIVNDRGIHICKSMLAWLKYGNGETPESSGKKGEQVNELKACLEKEGLTADAAKEQAEREAPLMKEAREMLVKWEQNDPEVRSLWEKMNNWVYAGFDQTYRALGVGFDKIYYESKTYLDGKAKVLEGLAQGLFFRKDDGSVWIDLAADGLDQKLLLRADGTSVYMTQDIGTATQRFNDYDIDNDLRRGQRAGLSL